MSPWAEVSLLTLLCSGRPQRAIEELLVAESAAEFALEAADRDEVLRCTRVLMRGARKRREDHRTQVGESAHFGDWQVRRALEPDYPGPRRARRARQAQVPRIAAPGCAHRERRRALSWRECANGGGLVRRQVSRVVGLDENDCAVQVSATAERSVDEEQVA